MLKDLEEGSNLEFIVVGTAEADPQSGKISVESPVSRAILGQANGQVVEVKVPAGKLQYQIMDICR